MQVSEENFVREIIKLKDFTTPTQLAEIEELLIANDDAKNVKYPLAYAILDLCELAGPHKEKMANAVIGLLKALGQRPKVLMELFGDVASTLKIEGERGLMTPEMAINALNIVAAHAKEVERKKDSEAVDYLAHQILSSGGVKSLIRG